METLFKISKILSRPVSIELKSNQVLEIVRAQVEADSAIIRILDTATDSLKLLAKDGLISSELIPNLGLSDEGISQRIFKSGNSTLLTDYANDPGSKSKSVANGISSMYGIPFHGATGPVGLLSLASKSSHHFNTERRDLLEPIADELAVLFDSELLSENLAASQKEMSVVDGIARIMTSTLDLEDVYQPFFDELETIVRFDLAGVTLVNEETGLVDVVFLSDKNIASYKIGDSFELSGSVFSLVIDERGPIIIDNIPQRTDYWASEKLARDGFQSMIQVPLISDEKVIGAFTLFSLQNNTFGQRAKDIVERLASQIAPSVRNALAYRREEQLATALESIGEAVAFLDSNAQYRRVNRAFEELYGYSEDEVRGIPINLLPVWDHGNDEENLEIMKQGFTTGGLERWLERRNPVN